MVNDSGGVSVTTGARLHFGLFDTRPPFGGIGLMIDRPETRVVIEPADEFSSGPLQGDRLTEIARRFGQRFPDLVAADGLPPCGVRVVAAAPAHCGLGSGTQLALATAAGLARYFGLELTPGEIAARLAGRGCRSGIGSIGFFSGGLILETGTPIGSIAIEAIAGSIAPDAAGDSVVDVDVAADGVSRCELPSDWRVLLIRPLVSVRPICGEAEGNAFAALPAAPPAVRSSLASLANQVLTAGRAGDFEAFSRRLTEFNRRSGGLFGCQQGGCYNGPEVTRLVETVIRRGGTGVGQSSWGPTVFAFSRSPEEAASLQQTLTGDALVTIARPRSEPAEAVTASGSGD